MLSVLGEYRDAFLSQGDCNWGLSREGGFPSTGMLETHLGWLLKKGDSISKGRL